MCFRDIIYSKDENGIVMITLNKSDRLNAMSPYTFYELSQAVDQMKLDNTVKVVILTGAGRAFSSGGDFTPTSMVGVPEEILREIDMTDIAQIKLSLKLWNFDKPVIAAINGLALGAGITMPLIGADLIFIAEDAEIGFIFVKRAITPEFGSTYLVPFLIGFHKAKELFYSGERISAKKAWELGLVNKVLPSDELLDYSKREALRLAKGPSLALSKMKRAMHSQFDEIFPRVLGIENVSVTEGTMSQDFIESMMAWREKREPMFKGE